MSWVGKKASQHLSVGSPGCQALVGVSGRHARGEAWLQRCSWSCRVTGNARVSSVLSHNLAPPLTISLRAFIKHFLHAQVCSRGARMS